MKNAKPIYLLLIANAISGVSQGITMLAVPWYFAGIIHREDLFGIIYFAVTFISLFWGVYAGTLIDRHDRKKIFLILNVVGFTVLAGLSAYGFIYGMLPWYLVACAFGMTALIYNIHFPNLYAYAQEITPKEEYSRITSLLEIQGQISFTLAGGIGAILLNGFNGAQFTGWGPGFLEHIRIAPLTIYEIFSIDASTYVAAFIMIYCIKAMPVSGKKVDTSKLRERLTTGFNFLRNDKVVFRFGNLTLLVFLTVILFGTYIGPIFVDKFLSASGNVYALSEMFFSAGALLAGFLTSMVIKENNNLKGLIILCAISGCMYLTMLTGKSAMLFLLANFVIGICNSGIRILRITYLFHHIPNHILGRVSSIFFVANVAFRLMLIGIFTAPFFHTVDMIFIPVVVLGGICFVGAFWLLKDYSKLLKQPASA
jgi:DHA3 family macrolide efflux protein-like MFS transporter